MLMNSFLNVVFRESPLDSPFVPKAKCGGAGAAVAADFLGGLAGSLINFFASDNTDTTNMAIARKNMELQRETNAQNYKMFQEQNAWNEDMWNKQNAYNTPAAVAGRLRAAGINPAVLGSNVSTPAGSVNSQQAPQFAAPQMNYKPITPVFDTSFIGEAVNAFYDNQLKNEQAKKVAADGQISKAAADTAYHKNMMELMKMGREIDNILADTHLKESEREFYKKERDQIQQAIDLNRAQWDDLVVTAKKNNQLTDANTNNQLAQATAHRAQAHLTNIMAEFEPDLMQSNINLNNANAQAALQSVVNMVIDGKLSGQKAIAQELQNQMDIPKVKQEIIKSKMRNGKRFIRRLLNSIELVSESLASGVRGVIKW